MNVKNLKYISLIMVIFGLAIMFFNFLDGIFREIFFVLGGVLVFLGVVNFYLYSKKY